MQPRTINLNTVVTDTLRLLRRTIGEDIDVMTHLDDGLHNARLDPDQLAQVIMNLGDQLARRNAVRRNTGDRDPQCGAG